jgi:hypothetical protein
MRDSLKTPGKDEMFLRKTRLHNPDEHLCYNSHDLTPTEQTPQAEIRVKSMGLHVWNPQGRVLLLG